MARRRRLDGRWVLAILALCVPALVAAATDSPVADAAMRGEVERVRTLLKEGGDVNAAQGDGMTALHWAARNGDVEIAEMLVYAGANVEATTRMGDYTPLLVAAQNGNAGVVETLLAGGADPDTGTSTGATPLMLAARAGDLAAVRALLDRGAAIDAQESAQGQTALMLAAVEDNVAVIEELLARGADPALATVVVDVVERSEQDDELRERWRERLRESQEEEAEEEEAESEEEGRQQQQQQQQRQQARRQGQQAQQQQPPAQRQGQQAQQQGQRPPAEEEPPSEDEESEEAAAGGEGEDEPTGAEEEEEEEDEPEPLSYEDLIGRKGGFTALHLAARQGSFETVRRLVEAGADVDQVSEGDHTSPMLIATINGHFDLALYLLEQGADPNLASDAGATPLYAALNVQWAPKALYPQPRAHLDQQNGHLDLMRALLEAGADPDVRLEKKIWYSSYNFDLSGVDEAGATPFWRAAYGLDVAAMKLLVEYGADPTVPTRKQPERRYRRDDEEEEDFSGLPPVPVGGPAVHPIHAASGVGYGERFAANSHQHVPEGWMPAMRYLVEEIGADVNARDHKGYSPLHHAAARGDTEMILYLVSHGADVTVLSRRGKTVADMANGAVQRVQPYPETLALLERLGSKNSHECVSC